MPVKGDRKANPSKRTLQQREYDSSPEVKKKRAMRNKARRQAERDGRVSKGDGKDIDHKTPLRNGGGNSKGNLRVRSRSANRSDNGGKGGRPKGT
jgi:5-methylcytosine-specific restriction endonuclease McrA